MGYRVSIKTVSILALVLSLAGCGAKTKDDGDDVPAGSGGTTPTASGGATAAGSGGGPVAMGSGGATVTGSGGGTVAGSGGATAGSGGTVAMGSGGATVTPDAGPPPDDIELVECESDSRVACGSFTTITGVHLDLGPYGAIMEPNVGAGFENDVASGDSDGGASCITFCATFGEPADQTEKLLDTKDLNFALYTVYRPAKMVEGEKYPVVTWGNGTCAQPEGYGALLRYVASYGYFVIAANSRWVGSATEILHALDYAAAANEDATSPYYHRMDLTKVAAAGHSQGSGGAANAADDARVNTALLFNLGSSASKPFLAISGDMDITGYTGGSMAAAIATAPAKGAYLFYHMVPVTGNISGHLTLMLQPDRVSKQFVGWLDMMFRADATATSLFVGDTCGFCGKDAEYEYGEKGLP